MISVRTSARRRWFRTDLIVRQTTTTRYGWLTPPGSGYCEEWFDTQRLWRRYWFGPVVLFSRCLLVERIPVWVSCACKTVGSADYVFECWELKKRLDASNPRN